MRRVFFLSLVVILLFTGCRKRPEEKGIVARVNGEPITLEEFNKVLLPYSPSKEEIPGLKRRVLDQLIEKRLNLQEARRMGLAVTDEELNQRIKETMGSYPKSEFVTFLTKEGTTFEEWKNGVKENILLDKLITSQVYLPLKVSEKEIITYYQEHQDQFREPKRFRIRQILVENQAEAEEILKALGKGEGFEELARKRSLSPDKERGGDMGYFSTEEMLAEWEEAVGKLSPGEVSYPVESPYGWHIFKLEKVLPPRMVSLKEARKEIKEKLLLERREGALKEWLLGLRVQAKIEINEELLR
ncbi:peptidyl-prolyl cis-trans isomerase [bacterium]|nr:peptidyl-prolyl cis-trans isomerase [bacterium]MBU4310488.1 peptidyl-prolyl cis-trans isomerase [bacterium]MBU4560777.1 peptidyl-prolyl cis-trans isomerase [bacterium]MCG2676054.1 peptidyl-prolyl cis-trans isomerase [bacterium]MCG2677944.1 peptidyl-prolyl cis-trans isomerase [bacterium]